VLLRSISRIGEDEVKLHGVLAIAFDEAIPEGHSSYGLLSSV
jgi:hypothetical protein